ncbi:MAG TPA: T9SS type A sorting domain-containing protein [Draconibacterium sp.]|nr:T9SS type A sorting domain-containing protein [Draconibacterium sp.]
MRKILLFVAGILFLNGISSGQISQGGKPLETLKLKSAQIPVAEMPSVDNNRLKKQAIEDFQSTPKLKPFQFATPFEVNFTTKNSGEWTTAENGTKIWLLKIHSKGAKSINLIFDHFSLPAGARLFLYNGSENYYLGAYTSFNNKPSGKFAVSPVAGDELTVQYELPATYPQGDNFTISRVNHDFVGILKYDDRRPLDKVAGACNVDVNCDIGHNWKDVRDAVCRLIVNGKEICSGTLINNTAEDQKPYIISAAHCYDEWNYAETTIYAFNYESPYCAPLDGDPSNSISGAVMKAQFDSLDFALAEMSLVPPPEFRPYYAGWDRSGSLPDSSVTIHHPQGDIKKISFDYNSPVISDFNSDYISNGFLEVLRWEEGVTEAGSSGGPLFNPDKNIIGTLTGGLATCSNPVRDYFERLDLSWNFKSDSTKQLKYWLDPLNTKVQHLNGERFYTGSELCAAFTHLNDGDEHQNVQITNSRQFAGYWGGTNSIGITEFMEHFSGSGNEELQGISMGVGKIDASLSGNSKITIKVYNGNTFPVTMIFSQTVSIKSLTEDAMNFIGFAQSVQPSQEFFVGFELSQMQPQDTFVVYQSLRQPNKENFFLFKSFNQWFDFNQASNGQYSMANVFELVACNVDEITEPVDSFLVKDPLQILVYPNPTDDVFTLETGKDIELDKISVFNLIGKSISFQLKNKEQRKVQIDLSGNVPGVYFVRYNNEIGFVTKKVSYVPW